MSDAKQCPHCKTWALKDGGCSYIFACGLDEKNTFQKDRGCGKSWCWTCGKKYCGQYYNKQTGQKCPDSKDSHDSTCCTLEQDFQKEEYCPGGHSSHCERRW